MIDANKASANILLQEHRLKMTLGGFHSTCDQALFFSEERPDRRLGFTCICRVLEKKRGGHCGGIMNRCDRTPLDKRSVKKC